MKYIKVLIASFCAAVIALSAGQAFSEIKCGNVIISEGQFRAKYPNTFFPSPLSVQAVTEKGCSFYTPPPPPPAVPQSITPAQARRILLKYNLLDTVEQLIPSLSREAQIKWYWGNSVDRYDELLIQAASLVGLTEAQLDQMFIEASQL